MRTPRQYRPAPWVPTLLFFLACGSPAGDGTNGSFDPGTPSDPVLPAGDTHQPNDTSNTTTEDDISITTTEDSQDPGTNPSDPDSGTTTPDNTEDTVATLPDTTEPDSEEPPPVLCPPTCDEQTTAEDPLVYIATYDGDWFVEIVDLATDSQTDTVYVCSGTRGLLPVDVSDLALPSTYWVKGLFGGQTGPGMTLPRCQHVAVLDTIVDQQGKPIRAVALTHHGDELGKTPFLRIVEIPDKPAVAPKVFTLTDLAEVLEPDVIYEGLAVSGNHLFVATHGGGLRVYAIEPNGAVSFISTVSGFENAWNVLIYESLAYVADAAGGLKVVDISDVEQPQIIATVELPGIAKDLTITEQTLAVSLGTEGVAVLDVSNPKSPQLRSVVETYGSATALASADGIVHVANWNDLLSIDVRDVDKPLVVASDSGGTTKDIPRFLAVDAIGTTVFGGEWTGLQTLKYIPNAVAPEVRFLAPSLDFGKLKDAAATQALVVYNDGYLPLTIKATNLPPWATVKPQSLEIPPRSVDVFEVTVGPSATKISESITFTTTDPDEQSALLGITANLPGVGIGDTFPAATFQDYLTGEPVLAKDLWQGKVTLLAYFATF